MKGIELKVGKAGWFALAGPSRSHQNLSAAQANHIEIRIAENYAAFPGNLLHSLLKQRF